MKKYIFTLGFLAVFGMANAQKFSVADVEVMQGGTVNVALTIDTESAGDYTGFQFEAYVPEGFTTTGASTVDNNTWDKTKKSGKLSVGDVLVDEELGDHARFLATSDDVVLPAGEFQVATFELQVDKSVETGTYDVTIKNFAFLIQTGGKAAVDNLTFKVNVVDYMTLDENATEAPKAANGVKVLVKRTIADKTWSTGCFPFAMDAAQIKTAFGDGVQLGEITGCKIEEDDDENVVAIAVGFKSISTIEANRPFIIKVVNPISQFIVEGVNITPESDPELEAKDFGKKAGMYGTYVANTPVPEENLFLNNGKFWYSKGDNKMKAFRAYFELKETLAAYDAASRIYITFDDVTAIKNVKTNGEEEIYTLSGQRVDKAGKGVYIVNGKKVIKK